MRKPNSRMKPFRAPRRVWTAVLLCAGLICALAAYAAFAMEGGAVAEAKGKATEVAAKPELYPNLLDNGGFELDANRDGKPDGWTVEGVDARLISSPVAEGKRALRLEAAGMKSGAYASLYQKLSVTPLTPYRFETELLAKRLEGAKGQLLIDFFDASGKWTGDNEAVADNAAGGFVTLELEGIVPEKAAYAFVLFRLQSTRDGGNGLVVVDAMSMRTLSTAPPQTTSEANEEPDAQVLVDGVDVAALGAAATSGSGKSGRTLSVLQQNDRLYALAEGEDMPAANVLYIDSDNDARTGSRSADWPEAGIDYKVEWNRLWSFDPSTAGWRDEGAVLADLRSGSAGFAVYLQDLGIETPASVRIGYKGVDGTFVPAKGKPLLSTNVWRSPALSAGEYRPKELYGPLDNPFVGWMVTSRGSGYRQVFSLVTANISWRDLEPVRGQIDWEGVDRKYHLSDWTSQGKKFVIRIVLDEPGSDPSHKDIPDWLYDELRNEGGTSAAGTWYRTDSGSGFSPNYANPTLIREHKRLIRGVAAKWDQDPGVAFIQIGSLGHYGEFQTSLLDTPFPNVTVSDAYVQPYVHFFENKKLAMRKPFPIAAESGMGLFNDMFGEIGSTAQWLDWIAGGWPGIQNYAGESKQPELLRERSKMPDFWTRSYSGGEFASNRTAAEYVDDGLLLEEAEQIRLGHTSWIGASALSWLLEGDGLTKSEQANADYLRTLMGYRFVLESVVHDTDAAPGGKLPVRMQWMNKGVAPFYYPWKLELALADANGSIVPESLSVTMVDLRTWLPGSIETNAELAVPVDLPDGRYKLLVGIVDPLTGRPSVQLAIEGRRNDGWYELNEVDVRKSL